MQKPFVELKGIFNTSCSVFWFSGPQLLLFWFSLSRHQSCFQLQLLTPNTLLATNYLASQDPADLTPLAQTKTKLKSDCYLAYIYWAYMYQVARNKTPNKADVALCLQDV